MADKGSGKIRGYEVTPFRMHLAASPVPASGVIPAAPRDHAQPQMPKEIPIVGVTTRPAIPAEAERDANRLLQEYRRRYDDGDHAAVARLLDVNAEFISVPWVREAYGRMVEEGRLQRRRGRPIGRDEVNPLIVAGLVDYLIETKRVRTRSKRSESWKNSGS